MCPVGHMNEEKDYFLAFDKWNDSNIFDENDPKKIAVPNSPFLLSWRQIVRCQIVISPLTW